MIGTHTFVWIVGFDDPGISATLRRTRTRIEYIWRSAARDAELGGRSLVCTLAAYLPVFGLRIPGFDDVDFLNSSQFYLPT
jgi:hypothetical protein